MSSFSITRTRNLTVDLSNFSYGGNTPLYSTFESELNIETINQHIHGSSSEDDIIGYQDDSEYSDEELTNKHYPTITPFNTNPECTNKNHTNTSKSMILTAHQNNSTSNASFPIPNQNRKRAQSTKFTHITSSSFHHFHIRSITINPNTIVNINDSIDNTSYINDDDDYKSTTIAENDNVKPIARHRSTGTVIIDGHPPLPTLPLSNNVSNSDISSTIDSKSKSNSKTKYKIIPKKKRKTVGFASNVIDPKRKYIEKEIIETEETYYRGLYILLNELIIPMFENGLISQKYKTKCISNIPQLLSFHDKFLTELVEIYEYQKTQNNQNNQNKIHKYISQVFNAQNKEEFINLYLKYIGDYDNILDLFGNTFYNNKNLQIFLKQKRKEKKPLTNYLILPVQRIPRYILLLKDLKKHTLKSDIDYKNIENALKLIEEIANEINERKREIENMSQCLQIQESLLDLNESIVKQGRKYEKQFVFIKKGNNHQRQFFVFTDIIIVTNSNWKVKHILDIKTIDIKFENIKKKIKK